jgi:autotransporter-associated beta strand protein
LFQPVLEPKPIKLIMKAHSSSTLTLVTLFACAQLTASATVFFSDVFTNGSTLNSTSPANPTPTNTAYQILSTKAWSPAPAIAARDLSFGFASTSSGLIEVQALFATNPIALVLPGDNMQLTIVFTNRSGILPASAGASQLDIGLFNSGNIAPFKPFPGGTNVSTGLTVSDYAQKWLGYVGQIVTGASKMMTRPSQASAADGWNQELVLSGSNTGTARNQANVGATTTTAVTLTTGATYTEVLAIVMNDVNSLTITNTLYSGVGTGGTVVVSSGGIATNTTFVTGGFNGLGFGYQTKVAGSANIIDVASVQVVGSVTPVTGPPTIDQQPVDVMVPNGASAVFNVAVTGYSVTYQWKRNGTNLLNGGNISGATTSQLVISPAGSADVLSGANGYSCFITGAGSYSTNSFTNSLTLVSAKNLVWAGAGSAWDLNSSANWLDPVNPATFNYGDNITFNNVGAGNTAVNLSGNFLSPASITIDGSTVYNFAGTGIIAGNGTLLYKGSGFVSINNANTYSGGTTISNASAYLDLKNVSGLGTGPLTLAMAGGKIEVEPTASAASGFGGPVNVKDDFTIQFDGTGQFAGVFLGDINGVAGKTLTLTPKSPYAAGQIRFRAYGTNTVCNSALVLAGNTFDQAQLYGTTLAFYGGGGSQTYNGVISGDGGIISRGNGTTYLNGANTYAGGSTFTVGAVGLGNDSALGAGPINLTPENGGTTGSGTVFASGGARTIANTIQYPSGTNNSTLIIGGTNDITFTSNINLNGADGIGNPTNRTFTVNNAGATTLSGIISDSSANSIGFTKNGTNTLYLNGANTYSGLTTVSAGTLAGSGSLAGSVLVTTNARISGGAAAGIGQLSVGGSLVFTNGGGFFRLNRAGSASDQVAVTGNITNNGIGTVTGTITVTNLGAPLQVNDTFALFNKGVTNGGLWAVSGGNVNWTNKLALNGTIQVLSLISPPTLTNTLSGTTLTLSWGAGYLGWYLQAQTNALSKGLSTNWVAIPGSSAVTSTNLTVVPGNPSVFYRLSQTP